MLCDPPISTHHKAPDVALLRTIPKPFPTGSHNLLSADNLLDGVRLAPKYYGLHNNNGAPLQRLAGTQFTSATRYAQSGEMTRQNGVGRFRIFL